MKKKRKSRFFNDLRLRKCTFGFMLSILVVCSVGKACADEPVSGGSASGPSIRKARQPHEAAISRSRFELELRCEPMISIIPQCEASSRTALCRLVVA